MAWWTSPNVYPKRKNKFIVEFGGGHRLFNVKTCTLPSVEVATKEYTLINHKFNYPGIPTWQPVKMTFVDVIGLNQSNKVFIDTSDFLFNMLNNSGYYYPDIPNNGYKKSETGNGHVLGHNPDANENPRQANSPLTTTEKASTIENSFGSGLIGGTPNPTDANSSLNRSIQIIMIDDLGTTMSVWRLVNPIITNISWGELDYSSDELLECTLDLKYDWAEFEPNGLFIGERKPAGAHLAKISQQETERRKKEEALKKEQGIPEGQVTVEDAIRNGF
jgi:hypothetical protein